MSIKSCLEWCFVPVVVLLLVGIVAARLYYATVEAMFGQSPMAALYYVVVWPVFVIAVIVIARYVISITPITITLDRE